MSSVFIQVRGSIMFSKSKTFFYKHFKKVRRVRVDREGWHRGTGRLVDRQVGWLVGRLVGRQVDKGCS